jgi:hypothetical protein
MRYSSSSFFFTKSNPVRVDNYRSRLLNLGKTGVFFSGTASQDFNWQTGGYYFEVASYFLGGLLKFS